jgi:hypothetical protein
MRSRTSSGFCTFATAAKHTVETGTRRTTARPGEGGVIRDSSPLRLSRDETHGNLATPESPSTSCVSAPACPEKRHLTEASIWERSHEFLRRAAGLCFKCPFVKSPPVPAYYALPAISGAVAIWSCFRHRSSDPLFLGQRPRRVYP